MGNCYYPWVIPFKSMFCYCLQFTQYSGSLFSTDCPQLFLSNQEAVSMPESTTSLPKKYQGTEEHPVQQRRKKEKIEQ